VKETQTLQAAERFTRRQLIYLRAKLRQSPARIRRKSSAPCVICTYNILPGDTFVDASGTRAHFNCIDKLDEILEEA
jgi:hypothetical protein